ncbi:MAG TPA: hypothetical protein VFP35_04510 [Candidatus Saccharimonadales bacterium]|nr:hypothetical protein [Candidatus Saccharimonadales bacterium]
MNAKKGIDSHFCDLRESLTDEAAQAYVVLGGEHNQDVVLWETMAIAAERSRALNRLLKNPGWFIGALYNTYGEGEYQLWRDEVTRKAKDLQDG